VSGLRPELQDIIDEAASVLGQPMTLEDRQLNLIAFAAQRTPVDEVRQNSILQRRQPSEVLRWFEQFGIADSKDPVATPADPARGILPRLCFPIRWRAVTYGYIWALGEPKAVDDPAVFQVKELAEHAGSYLYQLDRQREDQSLVVADLLSSDSDLVRTSALRASDQGLLAWDRPVACLIVGAWNPAPTEPININLSHLPKHVLARRGPTSTTLLLQTETVNGRESADALARSVIALYEQRTPAGDGSRIAAGIGQFKSDLTQARTSWMEAKIAVRVAASDQTTVPVQNFGELGIYRLVACAPDPDLYAAIIDKAVGALTQQPDETLVTTVLAYLDRAGRATDTAEFLNIHRQTLYYRLEKAQRITGLDFSDGRHRTRLHIALLLAPILREGQQDGR